MGWSHNSNNKRNNMDDWMTIRNEWYGSITCRDSLSLINFIRDDMDNWMVEKSSMWIACMLN